MTHRHDRIARESQAVSFTPSVDAVIAAVAHRREPAVLDSAATDTAGGRYTIVAADPVEVVSWPMGPTDPFEGMRECLARTRIATGGHCEDTGPGCGWIGYFAYEAGRYIEPRAGSGTQTRDDLGLPVARFGLYDTIAVHDARTGQWTLVAVDLRGVSHRARTRPAVEDRLDEWTALLREAKTPARPVEPHPPAPAKAVDNMTRDQYLRMVARAKAYIADGDIFQVNLARRQTFDLHEPAGATYLRLRRTNPGAYSALLAWNEPTNHNISPVPGNINEPRASARAAAGTGANTAILSTSPELFLQLRGNLVLTRPIKGTRPRSDDPITDTAYQMDLAASEKDRAELAMIVDLERNDLGRVCEFGTVRVVRPVASAADPYQLETHPTVHHLVADVTGRLGDSCEAIDLLRACFPGGSITGAPKVRAMQIIDELEPHARSVYTGAIGHFGLDGSMTLSIAIRTVIVVNGQAHVYAGGGIVADSVPEDEFEETRDKARGICQAFGMTETSTLTPVGK